MGYERGSLVGALGNAGRRNLHDTLTYIRAKFEWGDLRIGVGKFARGRLLCCETNQNWAQGPWPLAQMFHALYI